ncbi:MAG: DUF169 domain-containing protein [Promethearchaeia archaeon]
MKITALEKIRNYGEEIQSRLKLRTYPLALKLLKSKNDIPSNAQRPLEDFGHHLSLCQAFQKSRREGIEIAMLKEDMWCFEPVVGYGLAEPPDYFMEGHNRYPVDVETEEAGRHYAEQFPRFDVDRYVGLVFAPLESASFQPDIVMIYCDSEQLNILLLAREYKDGYNLPCNLSSHAACVYAVVPAIKTGKCQVAVPCRGDRWFACAHPEEMIFSVPAKKLHDLMEGLRHVNSTDSTIPHSRKVKAEYEMEESYRKIAEMIGYIDQDD